MNETLEQQMGYVLARLEELREDSKEMQAKLVALERRVDDKFKTAEGVFRTLKWLGAMLLAVLTLPWGSIKAFLLSIVR